CSYLVLAFSVHRASFVLFFLSILLLPLSPLFPYTTLFRSVFGQRFCQFQHFVSERDEFTCRIIDTVNIDTGGADQRVLWPTIVEDRKSTRLNSSHVSISYAVFCLKKKKKTP